MVNVNSGFGGFGYGGAPGFNPGSRKARMQPGCVFLKPLKWLGALIIVAGIAVALIGAPWSGLWKLVRGSADAVGNVDPGESGEVELGESGEWILYAEGDNTVDDCGDEICRGNFVEPELVVTSEDGEVLELSGVASSVSDAGTESVSLVSFDVEEAQTVTLTVGESDIDTVAVAKSPELELKSFTVSFVGLGIMTAGIFFRGAVGVVGGFFRT
jgi:hypothetical protein